MGAVLTPELLQSVVDHALRDVMPQVGGITPLPGGPPPSGDVYTVHTVLEGDTRVNLALCADTATFTHLTRHMMQQEQVAPEDLADAATEFFNVLCGHVAVDLFQATRLVLRFQIPRFEGGRRLPEGIGQPLTATYCGDGNESMQIFHTHQRGL